MTADSLEVHSSSRPGPLPSGPGRPPRWAVPVFLTLAYGLSWWPWLGQLTNPDSAPVIPIGPSIAAVLVMGWAYGRASRRAWLRSSLDPRIGRCWWAPVLPLVVAVASAVVAVALGAEAPSSAAATSASATMAILPLILVVNGPLGEELGWRGFLLPVLLGRHSPVVATVLLVPAWWLMHLPLVLTAPDRFGVWWAASVAGLAFVMTWLHLASDGNVLLAIVFHAVVNTASPAAIQLFEGGDRDLVVRLFAMLWVALGVAAARRLSRRHRPSQRRWTT